MRLHRFYIQDELSEGAEITSLDQERIHQWLSVFRFTAGDRVILFNGNGFEYEAEFLELHKKKAVLQVGEKSIAWTPEKKIVLYMSVIKKDLFELVVEKATELGVSEIVPVFTQRSVVKNLNMERLERIAIEASEQCGRGDVPNIHEIKKLDEVLDGSVDGLMVLDMGGENLSANNVDANYLGILIGPEGGWDEAERKMFQEKGIKSLSLGPTTLRGETAAIVAVASFTK